MLEVTILLIQFAFSDAKRKEELQGMLPVRREAIRNMKRRLLKLKKKRSRRLSTIAQRVGQETGRNRKRNKRNSRLWDIAQHGQEKNQKK
ncbi:hypothetical protein AVEN_61780-1 [Araneus ventricosus]|uniref:Uncharacterized protein n=1 Tax=Araneus ventricosus TaxID=182803 RepID=A0A4Y2SR17_ARAVE|nr:hypothetical protein AVEN_61780-1 [Araneus ventricosus]